MAAYRVRIEGLDGVMDTLRALPREAKAGKVIRTAVRKGALVLREEARANVRRIVAEPNVGGPDYESTGALEAAITVTRRAPQGGLLGEAFHVVIRRLSKKMRAGLAKGVLPPSVYGSFLEFGTERMRAHSFMRPAFELKKEEALRTVVDGINDGLARLLRKLERQNRVKS